MATWSFGSLRPLGTADSELHVARLGFVGLINSVDVDITRRSESTDRSRFDVYAKGTRMKAHVSRTRIAKRNCALSLARKNQSIPARYSEGCYLRPHTEAS